MERGRAAEAVHEALVVEAGDFRLAEVDLQAAEVFHRNGTLLNQVEAPERGVGLVQEVLVMVMFIKLHPSVIGLLKSRVNELVKECVIFAIREENDIIYRWERVSARRQREAVFAIESDERDMRNLL